MYILCGTPLFQVRDNAICAHLSTVINCSKVNKPTTFIRLIYQLFQLI